MTNACKAECSDCGRWQEEKVRQLRSLERSCRSPAPNSVRATAARRAKVHRPAPPLAGRRLDFGLKQFQVPQTSVQSPGQRPLRQLRVFRPPAFLVRRNLGPEVTLQPNGRQCRPARLPIKEVDDDAQHDRPCYLTENKSTRCRFQARFVAVENGFVAPCGPSRLREEGGGPVDVRVNSGAHAAPHRVIDSPQRMAAPSTYLASGVQQGVDFMHL